MSPEVNWTHLIAEGVISVISGAGGLLYGIWRWGRKSAQDEQKVKHDYEIKISALASEFRMAMATSEKAFEQRLDLLVEQFRETLAGMRRQLDEDRLATERRFLSKDDFADWRREYRADFADLKKNIAEIVGRP